MVEMPWAVRTPQDKGRQYEKTALKARGARGHPGSGSGSIRFDGSSDDELIEVKRYSRNLSLTTSYLELLLQTAIRSGKQAVLIIKLPGLRLECKLYRDRED